jgi:hypothetical protein
MSEAKKATAGPDQQYEVLILAASGHRTIRRVYADDQAAAVAAVQSEVDASSELGTEVIDSALPGEGLGSGDNE